MSQGNTPKNLDGLFKPKSLAVIGASANPSKIGHKIIKNIIEAGYDGNIYPIHPKEENVLGHTVYKIVEDIPGDVDLAIIAIPQPLVQDALEGCARKGVKGVAVITSGFAEVGKVDEERKLKEIADQNNMALLGPNMLGLVYTPSKLNASFGPGALLPGKIAFISQSGALAIALMGWTVMEKIGLASLVSFGNKADIEEKELIEYFNEDANVDAILIYMEGIRNGQEFLKTKIKKPVIILKVGCSERGAKAAASHTGSLSGSDKIYEAAFKQLGVLRARTFTQAFDWSRAFSLPLPQGEDTVIITNGGGIGVTTTDQCEFVGIKLLDDPQWLEEKFKGTMPDFGSSKNPIDITGQGRIEEYQKAIRVALTEDKIKAAIILYCETAVADATEIAKVICEEYQQAKRNKPIVVAMVGGVKARDAIYNLNQNQIPAFSSVNDATSALKSLYVWKDISARPKDQPKIETPPPKAVEIIENVRKEKRNVLLEHEARQVLELCGVPMPKWAFAKDLSEAMKKAEGLYPLAMKITSPDIIHKTDVGGVVINIKDKEDLKAKYQAMMEKLSKTAPKANLLGVNLVQMVKGIECIVGLSQDPQFGPVVMFGLGGVFVEVLKDVSFRIVPFGEIEAVRLIEDIKSKKILEGFRGLAADKTSLVRTVCAVQKLAHLVKEIDINPLLTNQEGSFAVDARIIL
ncbi:MAG: acetate--CoA ligase family protein [Candidatus Omnitrophota bacterium]